jgi:hypothetical protein
VSGLLDLAWVVVSQHVLGGRPAALLLMVVLAVRSIVGVPALDARLPAEHQVAYSWCDCASTCDNQTSLPQYNIQPYSPSLISCHHHDQCLPVAAVA